MFWKLYAITLPVFFVIDMIWLGLVARSFYANQIGFLMKSNVNWVAAILFYLLFIGGLVVFVVQPAVAQQSLRYALVYGALFGLITYATYDLTNLATLKDWPLIVTIVDMGWGTVLGGAVAGIAYSVATRIFTAL